MRHVHFDAQFKFEGFPVLTFAFTIPRNITSSEIYPLFSAFLCLIVFRSPKRFYFDNCITQFHSLYHWEKYVATG